MFALSKSEPVAKELIPARGGEPAVVITFNAQPSPLSLRAARRAVWEIQRAGGGDVTERAGDAFTAAIIRHNIVSWTGIGDEAGNVVDPTPDRELRNDAGEVIGHEPGTISAFLAEPRLVEAADAAYVMPWAEQDAAKNGLSPSPNGTSEGETPEADIASSSASPAMPGAAKTAHTPATKRKPTTKKRSGS